MIRKFFPGQTKGSAEQFHTDARSACTVRNPFLLLENFHNDCYNGPTIKSARGTAPMTAQQPAEGKVLKAERWVCGFFSGSSDDGPFSL